MTVVLLVVAGALLAGRLRGGTLTGLSHLHLPGWPLVFLALAAQAFGAFAGALGLGSARAYYVTGMILSALLVTVFVARNRGVPGMPLVALGFLMNALVVTANGAMPVSADAAARAGLPVAAVYAGVDAKHEPLDDRTRLRPLADVIPVPVPTGRGSNVLSAGDVVLAAGIGVLVANGMLLRGGDRT